MAVIGAFAMTTATVILVMFLLIILIGTTQNRILQPIRSSSQPIKRWGGVILMFVGTWLIILSIWATTFAQIFPV